MVGTRNQSVSADGWGAPVGKGVGWKMVWVTDYRRRRKATGQGDWVAYKRCWGTNMERGSGKRERQRDLIHWLFLRLRKCFPKWSPTQVFIVILRNSTTSWWCSRSWNCLAVERRAIIVEKTIRGHSVNESVGFLGAVWVPGYKVGNWQHF